MYHDVGDQDVTYGVYVTGNRANVSQCYELHVDVDVRSRDVVALVAV